MLTRLALAALFALSLALPAFAQENVKPDDTIMFDLSGEDWVITKTAHVTLNVEAAVSAANAGSMRADMTKAVTDAAKGDWRLTAFNRSQDQTGLERWSASFEARLPETELNGLADAAKKASKAGMQVTVGDIDFSPTLDETEAVRAALRAHILKQAGDQLATINAALPGRAYRIAQVSFDPMSIPQPRLMRQMSVAHAGGAPMLTSMATAPVAEPSMDRSEKITLTAHVAFAAVAPAAPK